MTGHDSRLPAEDDYWHELAGRISTDAQPMLRDYHAHRGVWWSDLAGACPALLVVALLALGGAAITVTATPVEARGADADLAIGPSLMSVVEPDDALARTLLESAEPPRVETLLPVMSAARRQP